MGGENCLKWILSSHLQLGSKQCLRVPNMQWWEYVAIVLARNNIKHLSSIKHFKKFKSLHFKSLLFLILLTILKVKMITAVINSTVVGKVVPLADA